jgi:hypothetical protein
MCTLLLDHGGNEFGLESAMSHELTYVMGEVGVHDDGKCAGTEVESVDVGCTVH